MLPLKANDFIGNYRIIEKIGEGGMAHIYRAHQPALKRNVVVKKLKDPNREIINRFKKEALISASMHQENLAAIYDFIYAQRSYFLVMEYIDGEDLRTLTDYLAPLSPMQAAIIIMDIARGLEHIHARGIIHRDIKPSNILISRDGEVKLIDFGVAKDKISTRLTMTGMIVGTPAYMSPEQANGDNLSTQSDLFSLGILFYELLTGVKPFYGVKNTDVLARIVRAEYIPAGVINPQIPRRLRHILKKTLQRQISRRYQSATELIFDLERAVPLRFRVRKKDLLARLMNRLDKTGQPPPDSSVHISAFRNERYKYWNWLNILVVAGGIYASAFLGWQFATTQTGYVGLKQAQPGSVIRSGRQVITTGNNRLSTIGPFLQGSRGLTVQFPGQNQMHLAQVSVPARDTVFVQVPPAIAGRMSQVRLETAPAGAEIWLDYQKIGHSPVAEIYLQPGIHRLEFRKNGFHEFILPELNIGQQPLSVRAELVPAGTPEN